MSERDTTPDQGEPSMEDILASIRKILSDDKEAETEGATEPIADASPETPEESIESPVDYVDYSPGAAQSMVEPDLEPEFDIENVPNSGSVEPEPEPIPFEPPVPVPDTKPSNVLELTPQMRHAAEQQLISRTVRDQSTDVLTQLARAILDQRELTVATSQVTLEGMVREMLRPLLREWLDRNLPHIIERLVKQEIDQMVNRAERQKL